MCIRFCSIWLRLGIAEEGDLGFYRKLVVGSAWRKQMPKLTFSLGHGDQMPEIIEELISRGQQVDDVHFTQEVGLVERFPPVPLLKTFLKDAKKAATSIVEDPCNSGRAAHLAPRHARNKLEQEFPPENLKKRLELLQRIT